MNVLKHIDELLEARGWNYAALSKESGISESTISNFRKRRSVPSITTLESICDAFGITLSQFFYEDESSVMVTDEQKELLEKWTSLTSSQKDLINNLIDEFRR